MQIAWLLARGDDLSWILRLLVPLIVALIYAINQIFNRESKGQPKAGKPVARRIATPPAAKRGPTAVRPVNPQQSDPLLAEIQKFLKQSSQGKAAPARPPAVGKVGGSQPATLRRGSGADMHSDRPLDSLAGRHLDTGEVGAGASHLVDDLKRGDAERKQHFDDTFTHKLGSLTDTSSTGIEPSRSAAATMAAQSDQPGRGKLIGCR